MHNMILLGMHLAHHGPLVLLACDLIAAITLVIEGGKQWGLGWSDEMGVGAMLRALPIFRALPISPCNVGQLAPIWRPHLDERRKSHISLGWGRLRGALRAVTCLWGT